MTTIEWTERSWNPIVGCAVLSPGCTNCYAMRAAWRMGMNPATPQYAGLTRKVNGKPVWTGVMRLHEPALALPLRRRKPTTWFVNSMSDLFADGVTDDWLDRVFAIMARTPQHTYQFLTKRADRMRLYLSRRPLPRSDLGRQIIAAHGRLVWPLPNVWAGVSTEDQRRANERIPQLLATPAAVRWISAEPLLGAIDLVNVTGGTATSSVLAVNALTGSIYRPDKGDLAPGPRLDWVVVGGESGDGARPMHPDWARQLRDQCAEAGVPFFFKQWGEWGLGVGDDAYRALCAESDSVQMDAVARRIGPTLYRVGKKAAGRRLDGAMHEARP